MNKEKVKYGLKVLRNYLEIALVIYLVYAFVRTISGVSFKHIHSSGEIEFLYGLESFFLNSTMMQTSHLFKGVLVKNAWIIWIERFLVFIIPLIIIIWIELKEHNEKVKSFLDARKEKSLDKKKIKLQKQLNELKDKEL